MKKAGGVPRKHVSFAPTETYLRAFPEQQRDILTAEFARPSWQIQREMYSDAQPEKEQQQPPAAAPLQEQKPPATIAKKDNDTLFLVVAVICGGVFLWGFYKGVKDISEWMVGTMSSGATSM